MRQPGSRRSRPSRRPRWVDRGPGLGDPVVTSGIQPPLEHVPLDDHGTRQHPLVEPLGHRSDVDHQAAISHDRGQLVRGHAPDPAPCVTEQIVDLPGHRSAAVVGKSSVRTAINTAPSLGSKNVMERSTGE